MNDKRIKLTKKLKGKAEKIEYRHFGSNDDAVLECIKEEDWLKSEGYKAMNHKFIYTFIEEDKSERKGTKPKSDKSGNVLSITAMTNDAMSHRSRATSSAKSDRSFASD